jgi:hypothetical protein
VPRSRRSIQLVPKMIAPPIGQYRLRIAGARQPREEGFVGLDEVPSDSVDHVVSLKLMPWPVADEIVDTIFCAHYLYRLDPAERIAFMNECGRILKVASQLILVNPHWKSMRAVADLRAKYPPISELSFACFNKEWRERENLRETGIICDFDYSYGFSMDPDMNGRNQDYQNHAIKFWTNSAHDIHVTMTKRANNSS